MGPYLIATKGDISKAIDLYEWNSEIAARLLRCIGIFEVTFRNKVSRAMEENLKLEKGEMWFEYSHLGIELSQQLRNAKKSARKEVFPVTVESIVNNTTFGFWRFVFNKKSFVHIWLPFLGKAIGSSNPENREEFDEMRIGFERLIDLRNIAAHHGPLINIDLMDELENLFYMISRLSPVIAESTIRRSRILQLIEKRPI